EVRPGGGVLRVRLPRRLQDRDRAARSRLRREVHDGRTLSVESARRPDQAIHPGLMAGVWTNLQLARFPAGGFVAAFVHALRGRKVWRSIKRILRMWTRQTLARSLFDCSSARRARV